MQTFVIQNKNTQKFLCGYGWGKLEDAMELNTQEVKEYLAEMDSKMADECVFLPSERIS